MRLILTRHGATEENKRQILVGRLPGKLSESGREQARKLALRLKGEEIHAIYTSDLARSLDTAREVSRFHEAPLQVEQDLREADFGSLTGRDWKDIDWDDCPKDMESLDSLMSRARRLLHRVRRRHKGQTVVLVGHGVINKALEAVLLGKGEAHMNEGGYQPNAGITVFEVGDGKAERVLDSDTSHLG